MNVDKNKSSDKNKKFKFNDCFLHKFDKLTKAYDIELKKLKNMEKEIDGVSHGLCNNAYSIRYITPSDISTFIANLDRSLSASLIKPTIGDCNMFAVASAQKIIEAHNCIPFDRANTTGNQKNKLKMPKGTDLGDLETLVSYEVFKRDVYSKSELSSRLKFVREDMKVIEDMHFTANMRSLVEKLPDIISKHSDSACPSCDIRCKQMLGIYVCNFIIFALKLNLMTIKEMINYAIPMSTFKPITYKDESQAATDMTVQHCECPEDDNLNINESAVEENHFDHVITECYHITKPNAEIRSKIPFGVDLRTIALADNHPEYKDLKLAIEFITENPTSPFNQLLVQFADEDANCVCCGEVSTVMMMLFGNKTYDGDPYHREDVQFPSDVNWYDKMVFGNAYYDMNYRRDNPGNYTMNPITAKIDMLHKMYGVCHHENDSKTIANAIIKMKSLMMSIISKRSCESENMMPRQASTEFLAVIGEMMTKALLKLYYLNTRVLDASDSMDATMIPGYMYEESYSITEVTEDGIVMESFLIMEDGEEQKTTEVKAEPVKDTVIKNDNSGHLKGIDKAKHFLMTKGASVVNFIKLIIGRFFSNWEKAQEKLIKYIEDNKKLIDEIAGKLNDGSFKITLTNYANYNIPMDEIGKLDPKAVIDGYLTDGKEFKAIEFEREFYPEPVRDAIVGKPETNPTGEGDDKAAEAEDSTIKNRSAIMRNYILFNVTDGNTTGKIEESHQLKGEDLIGIRNMLIQTKTGISPIFKKINDSLKTGAEDLQKKIKENTNESTPTDEEQDASQKKDVEENVSEGDKYEKMLKIVERTSKIFNLTSIDALIGAPKNDKDFEAYTKSFWGRNYNILAGIIKEYKASGGSSAKATSTDTTTTSTTATPAMA